MVKKQDLLASLSPIYLFIGLYPFILEKTLLNLHHFLKSSHHLTHNSTAKSMEVAANTGEFMETSNAASMRDI